MKKLALAVFLTIGLVGYSQEIKVGVGEIYKSGNEEISIKKTSKGIVMFTFKDQHDKSTTIYFYKKKEAVHFFNKINKMIQIPDSAGDLTLSFSKTHVSRKGINDGTISLRYKYAQTSIDNFVIAEILDSLEG